MEKIEVGLKVFLRPMGNFIRRGYKIKETTVAKISRKYFYTEDGEKFEIDTLKNIREDCNSEWILYFSMQDIYDENEKAVKLSEIQKYFRYTDCYKLTLDQVREIYNIIHVDR